MSGLVFHAPLLASHPGFEVKKIVERSSQKSLQTHPRVEVVRSFEELLRDENIGLVVVNTPDFLHYAMAEQALRADKHVVVEKPFTLASAEAQALIALARERGRLLSVFQNRRWDGDFLTVQRVVESGWLGQLVEYESHYDRFRNYIDADNWKEGTKPGSPASAGLLYNLGSHLIDQALVLFGMPARVTADLRVQRPGGRIVDGYELILDYGGLKVTLKSSYLVREPGPRFVLHGTEGSFVKYGIDPQEEALKAKKTPGSAGWGQEPEADWGLLNTDIGGLHFRGKIETLPGNYLRYYDGVYDALTTGEEPAVKAEEAANGIRIIEAAMESSREKRSVAL
ncbi:MAG: Gfo/Idh/MocA family oxidoreductase [Ferruginibacter sp.]|nr:Gfo/Idh/MocA family oxidoreductase [Cytophagales bacterium]